MTPKFDGPQIFFRFGMYSSGKGLGEEKEEEGGTRLPDKKKEAGTENETHRKHLDYRERVLERPGAKQQKEGVT